MSETQPDLREALARAATVLICKGACLIPSMCAMCDARKQQAIKALSAQIEPILAQVSALQAEVERLQKVEGERGRLERVTSSPGYSSSTEPQSVSALTGEYHSRESVEILHGKIKNARAYADREDFLLSTICPSSEETDILLRALSEYAQAAQGTEARQGRDACSSVHDGPVATASTAIKNRSEAT
ncbi:hypothetical protein [Methylobacterium sp. CCH5-D2]|uniref:hypothetical protein n=1 Tax=Methylobacterium sp. CCH5-D2 TaxID=1768765 RepID=UPI00082BDD4F|nr:hypothetical protein [Methylobacterium sp. CCH5-D2]